MILPSKLHTVPEMPLKKKKKKEYTAVCLCKHPTEAAFQEWISKCTLHFPSAMRVDQQELCLLGKYELGAKTKLIVQL